MNRTSLLRIVGRPALSSIAAFLVLATPSLASAEVAPLRDVAARTIAVATDERTSSDLLALEASMQEAVEHALHATVGLRVRGPRGTAGTGSGVVVSADGLILTVGHIFDEPGQRFTVIFNDGRRARAESLGKNDAGDYGLVRITESADEPWPHAKLAESHEFIVDQLCFMAGHPAGIRNDNQPIVRFGSVIGFTRDWVQTSCIIMPGDSGGPLFNMRGEVIGINSWIGTRSTQNFSVPATKARDDWDRLLASEVWGEANWQRGAAGEVPGRYGRRGRGRTSQTPTVATTPPRTDVIAGGLKPALQNAAKLAIENSNTDCIVRITSRRNGQDNAVLGVIVDAAGFILTKASELGDHPSCARSDGSTHRCSVVAVDPSTDLALLRLNDIVEDLQPVQWAAEKHWQPGHVMLSPGVGGSVMGVGVVGAPPSDIPPSGSGFLGVVLDRTAEIEGALVEEVMDDSAASTVGMRDGDVVVSVDGEAIDSAEELIRRLSRRNAGDILQLELRRPGGEGEQRTMTAMSLRVQLNGRPLSLSGRGHAADRVQVSGRRGAFPQAVRHDTLLRPEECGGPVFDAQGLAVGVNIARLNRTGSLALPVEVVQDALDRLYKEAVVSPE